MTYDFERCMNCVESKGTRWETAVISLTRFGDDGRSTAVRVNASQVPGPKVSIISVRLLGIESTYGANSSTLFSTVGVMGTYNYQSKHHKKAGLQNNKNLS